MTKTHADQARSMETALKLYLFPQYRDFRRRTVQLADITPNDAILDFGCGVGLLEDYILPRLSEQGMVVGVDIGKDLIKIASERHATARNCEFRSIEPSGRLPFDAGKFDVVITSLVLHLLDRTQKETTLNEFLRILKPGGRLMMAEIGKPSGLFGHWIKFLTLHYWVKKWPYEVNSIDSFNGWLPGIVRQAGFRRVEMVKRMRGYVDFILCRP